MASDGRSSRKRAIGASGRVVHSIPHILTLVLGVVIFGMCHILLAPAYALIAASSMLYFLYNICPRCAAHDSMSCPSGYGIISARMFDRRRDIPFPKAFRRHIWSVAIQWFLPLGAGIACLYIRYPPLDMPLVLAMAAFILVAFVWLPLASRHKGCGTCPQSRDCPWKKA